MSNSGYRPDRYTAAEIEAANDTDLPELLSSLGYHVRRAGRFYTTQEMDSLRVWNRRTWYRYSEAVGGDAIAFLRHFHGMSFQEAVRYLLAFNGCSAAPSPSPVQRIDTQSRKERPDFALPPKYHNNERVRAYLGSRGIATEVTDDFIRLGLLYEDAKCHDCVFVGYNGAGKAVFAARRGTLGSFKGDVAGSDKRIAFRVSCGSAPDSVSVFEAPIDLMSFFTLYGQTGSIALCGLHDAPLATYLNDNPHVRRVIFCLDADKWGRAAAERLKTKYRALGYDTADQVPPSGKDWNEYLQKKGTTENAVIHKTGDHMDGQRNVRGIRPAETGRGSGGG